MIRKSGKGRKSAKQVANETAIAEMAATGLPVDQNPAIAPEVQADSSDNTSAARDVASTLGQDAKIQRIPFDRVFRHNNVRSKETEFVPEMVASLKRHGFKAQHPIMVSRKSEAVDKAGHDCLVLQGNRRVLALEQLRETDPTEFARVLPGGMIPAIVHDGLSEGQEAVLRIDHSKEEDRKPLDAWGWFLAVVQLVKAGFTQLQIVDLLGRGKTDPETGKVDLQAGRGWVQQRVNLAKLPLFVQDAMQAKWTRKEGNISQSDIGPLYAIYLKELNSYPAGNGPELRKAFDEIVSATSTAPTTKSLTASAVGKLQMSSAIGKELLTAAVRTDGIVREGVAFTDIDATLVKLEIDAQTLANIESFLGAKAFKKLVSDANAKATPAAA